MSRATAHADSDANRVESAKDSIAWLLRRRHGPDEAISSQALADAVGLKATTVRDLIPEIRREYELPIGSCPGGYFRISDHETFLDHMDRYQSQINKARQHQMELAKAWNTERYPRG